MVRNGVDVTMGSYDFKMI